MWSHIKLGGKRFNGDYLYIYDWLVDYSGQYIVNESQLELEVWANK